MEILNQEIGIDYTGNFNDKRLNDRANHIINQMEKYETAIINRFSETHSEDVAASRFFNNKATNIEALIGASQYRTASLVQGKHVLCISDTSEINLQKHVGKLLKTDSDLGPVGNNSDIGFFIHSSLVVDASNSFPLGVSSIIVFNRNWDKLDKDRRNYKEQPIEEKESYRWIVGAEESKECLSQAERITIVGDRESDIYEELARVPDYNIDLLIRASKDRSILESKEKLFSYLGSREVQGCYKLEVPGDSRKNVDNAKP